MEVDKDGTKRNIGGGKGNSKGTPQGGVISPLLANLYLHILDRIWDRGNLQQRLGARLVRYADDSVPRGAKDVSPEAPRCAKDEGRPLGAGLQEQASNHLKLHW